MGVIMPTEHCSKIVKVRFVLYNVMIIVIIIAKHWYIFFQWISFLVEWEGVVLWLECQTSDSIVSLDNILTSYLSTQVY